MKQHEADDFDDVEAARRHVLPVGKSLYYDDAYSVRLMFVGQVDVPESGKPVYHAYVDPRSLGDSAWKASGLLGEVALIEATDIHRADPEGRGYGFCLGPDYLDRPENTARAEFEVVRLAVEGARRKEHYARR